MYYRNTKRKLAKILCFIPRQFFFTFFLYKYHLKFGIIIENAVFNWFIAEKLSLILFHFLQNFHQAIFQHVFCFKSMNVMRCTNETSSHLKNTLHEPFRIGVESKKWIACAYNLLRPNYSCKLNTMQWLQGHHVQFNENRIKIFKMK